MRAIVVPSLNCIRCERMRIIKIRLHKYFNCTCFRNFVTPVVLNVPWRKPFAKKGHIVSIDNYTEYSEKIRQATALTRGQNHAITEINSMQMHIRRKWHNFFVQVFFYELQSSAVLPMYMFLQFLPSAQTKVMERDLDTWLLKVERTLVVSSQSLKGQFTVACLLKSFLIWFKSGMDDKHLWNHITHMKN